MTKLRTGEVVMASKSKIEQQYKGAPGSVKEAMSSPTSAEWLKAKETEDKSLEENEK